VSPKLTLPDLSSGVRECHGEVGMSIKISRRVAECPRCVRYGTGHWVIRTTTRLTFGCEQVSWRGKMYIKVLERMINGECALRCAGRWETYWRCKRGWIVQTTPLTRVQVRGSAAEGWYGH
jgi:hypothetical protein